MSDTIERLNISRIWNPRKKRATWTACRRLFTGRGCHMRAIAAARAQQRLADILSTLHTVHARKA